MTSYVNACLDQAKYWSSTALEGALRGTVTVVSRVARRTFCFFSDQASTACLSLAARAIPIVVPKIMNCTGRVFKKCIDAGEMSLARRTVYHSTIDHVFPVAIQHMIEILNHGVTAAQRAMQVADNVPQGVNSSVPSTRSFREIVSSILATIALFFSAIHLWVVNRSYT